ncbi:MAG: right-handed parallel beta-helix repeat-containing protein [Gemmataceae bacterium]
MQRVLLALVAAGFAQSAFAADYRVNDVAGLRRAMLAVRPGDRVLIAPGTYRGNHFFQNVHGAEGKPIVVMAVDTERPPRFTADNACLHISGASHLELRDLHLGGCKDNALNIDDAGNPDKPAHHITLKNIRIADVGPRGNVDGIKLSGVDDFQIIDCTVERWGGGGSAIDMVGCHRGELVGCTFKSGGSNGVQMKGGAADIVVRKCRFEDCGERGMNIGGNTGTESFRPPVKSMSANGRYEAKNITVEGCTFVGGSAAIACVGLDGGRVRYNTILRPEKYALRILQENTGEGFVPCRNVEFERNTVSFNSRNWGGVNVGPNTDAASFTFSKNSWYCEDSPARSKPQLPVKESGAEYGSDPKFAKDRGADAYPAKNSSRP